MDVYDQRHRDRRPGTTACPPCPGCRAMGTNKVEKCAVRKILFCAGLNRAAKAGEKSILQGQLAQGTNPGSLTMYSMSPHLPQFQQSAGATPLWSLFVHMTNDSL
jgi:hypothetical protein